MILIADSGSTKTEWIAEGQNIITQGINPVRDNQETILNVLGTELVPQLFSEPTEIHFYGAGCIEPFMQTVVSALRQTFPNAVTIDVNSDLLGAARALCGRETGIACILGTGSNSCLCQDGQIISNVSPLGYILGDEGSGAVLGRTLISDMLKGQLSPTLWDMFQDSMEMTQSDIIDRVYRQPQPNRFLASLVPFISRHRADPGIHDMLITEFTRFLIRNVAQYQRPDLPVNFVGGIASEFQTELTQAVESCGMIMGRILKKPAQQMMEYHQP